MSSLTSSRTGLLDLPNELLLMIKNSLDPHDLVSNVCYYLLCKRTAACYDKHSDADWMRLLRANGLGLGTYELLGESGHKLMAMECARHAWMCTHPQCGRARLQENRYSMQAAIEAWPSLNYEGTVKSPHFDVPPDEGPIVPSTLFAYIAFKNKRLGPLDGPLLSDPAYLRPVDQDIKQPPPEETLDDHPIVRRTFACFPPIDAMDVDSPFEVVRMQNRRGLITKDVCYFLGIHMGQKLYDDSLHDCIKGIGPEFFDNFPPWNLETLSSSARQIRDWFKLVRWLGFEYCRFEQNRWFVLKFEARELPESNQEIYGLSLYDEDACS